jgi:hypothetical protein
VVTELLLERVSTGPHQLCSAMILRVGEEGALLNLGFVSGVSGVVGSFVI